MPAACRILLVDDDPLVRSGLRLLLTSDPGMDVVGEVADGDEVVEAVQRHAPDVVLMDLRMARMDGVAATRAVRALPRAPHVIVLTVWDVDQAVLRSLEAGAEGFLLKSSSPAEILAAVRAVMAGDAVLSPRSTRQVLDHYGADEDRRALEEARAGMAALTDRERAVAVAVAEGLSNAEAAERLYVSAATVKAHLATIQTKLGVRNRVQVAVQAERAGLLR
ncbi:MAG TPA: response regulator transcription factor [Phototrophicaceae bacterium]|nr:response regulator transcription factor [Phototrophicaceae bacterium]